MSEQSCWRSFRWARRELAIVPLLVLVVAGLAVTLVGILLIPFAIVACVLAVAGLVTLGFWPPPGSPGAGIAASGDARDALQGLVSARLYLSG